MIIIHKINTLLFELFPTAKNAESYDQQKLEILLKDYYEYQGHKPTIKFEDDVVSIEIDINKIGNTEKELKAIVALCEKRKFTEAKKLLLEVIKKDPTNSESYRILGQISSDEGDSKEAIDHLIDALCWDPHNKWALIMMGNIFARDKNDIVTAMKYYDQAVMVDPTNNIALNNIGATLMEKGNLSEASIYFNKALEINKNYSNTHYALSMIADLKGDSYLAFEKALEALKLSNVKEQIYSHIVNQLVSCSRKIAQNNDVSDIINSYRKKLEDQCGLIVRVEEDDSIPTVAKLEVAENYDRDEHIVKFKPNKIGYQHLIMHELVHLDFIIQARSIEQNKLFITTQQHRADYISSLSKDVTRLSKLGYSDSTISRLMVDLFEGLNRQIFNTPIDLFIEDYLFSHFPEIRPFQFLSMYSINKEGIDAVTNKKVLDLIPSSVLRISKIYNIINVIEFRSLFGIDLISELKADKLELNQANNFWDEFLEYRESRKPAEEYELVQHWGEDLKMGKYFDQVLENDYRRKIDNPFAFLDDIEADPFSMRHDPYKEEQIKKFQEAHKDADINMAVVMFMVGALEKYGNYSKSELQPIAFEIAMIGTTGISPEKTGYKISKIPNVTFSGYQLLAYYYVTWKLYDESMHKKLGLPFDDEYAMAVNLFKSMN